MERELRTVERCLEVSVYPYDGDVPHRRPAPAVIRLTVLDEGVCLRVAERWTNRTILSFPRLQELDITLFPIFYYASSCKLLLVGNEVLYPHAHRLTALWENEYYCRCWDRIFSSTTFFTPASALMRKSDIISDIWCEMSLFHRHFSVPFTVPKC